LQGVLRILVCFMVVNRGEVAVICVVIVVNCVVFFALEKHATFFRFIFDALTGLMGRSILRGGAENCAILLGLNPSVQLEDERLPRG
jgi:hypothetical protein